MFVFHCHRCEESFRVKLHNLYNKESLSCNNCGIKFPDDALNSLRVLSESYMDSIDVLKRTGEHKNCWSISIAEDKELIPSSVGQYEHLWDNDENKVKSYWSHRNEI